MLLRERSTEGRKEIHKGRKEGDKQIKEDREGRKNHSVKGHYVSQEVTVNVIIRLFIIRDFSLRSDGARVWSKGSKWT